MTFGGNDFSINFSIATSCISTESFCNAFIMLKLHHVRETTQAITNRDSRMLFKIDLPLAYDVNNTKTCT